MPSPLEILDELLIGTPIEPGDLDHFIDEHAKEGLHHDFKDGAELQKPKPQPADTVREYLSSFANSEGGFLVVGVSEPTGGKRHVTGAKAPGGAPLDDWASSAILEMASFFSVQPRFQIVKHPKGEVLICSTARSAQLVPVMESRQWKYFIRTHHSTIEAPPYLISDLVLGRRNHPVLDVGLEALVVRDTTTYSSIQLLRIDVVFQVENASYMPANKVVIGILSWAPKERGKGQLISRRLLYEVTREVPEHPSETFRLNWTLYHTKTGNLEIPTFGATFATVGAGLVLPVLPSLDPVASAAVYVLAENAPAKWYALTCETPMPGEEHASWNAAKAKLTQSLRPPVNWQRIGRVRQ